MTIKTVEIVVADGIVRTETGLVDRGAMSREDYDIFRFARLIGSISPLDAPDFIALPDQSPEPPSN